jgi:hypothetical protein
MFQFRPKKFKSICKESIKFNIRDKKSQGAFKNWVQSISSRLRYFKIERSGKSSIFKLQPNFSLPKWKRSAMKVAAVYCLAVTTGAGGHAATDLVSVCWSSDFNWTPLQTHTCM